MHALIDEVSRNRLGGEPCPDDLKFLLTRGETILESAGIEISGDVSWAPWADKSYLTESDYRDPDIAANVKAIDDTFAWIRFVARMESGECIGYWCGPEGSAICGSPVVVYDTEGQFRLYGSRFVEALFFMLSYDDEALEQLQSLFAESGLPLGFDSLDDIVIPEVSCRPEAYHLQRYEFHKHA